MVVWVEVWVEVVVWVEVEVWVWVEVVVCRVQLAAGGPVLLQSRPNRPAICSRELTPSATLM